MPAADGCFYTYALGTSDGMYHAVKLALPWLWSWKVNAEQEPLRPNGHNLSFEDTPVSVVLPAISTIFLQSYFSQH